MRERLLLSFLCALCVIALGLYAFGQRANLAAATANRQAAEVNAAAMRGLIDGLRRRDEARACGDAGEDEPAPETSPNPPEHQP